MADDVTIDRISIDIQADAKNAADQINRLANAVSKLESVSASVSNLKGLDASISGLAEKLRNLDFSKLSGLKNLKFDDKAGTNLASVLGSLGSINAESISGAVDALRGLSGVKISKTLQTNIRGMVDAVNDIPPDLTGLKEVSRAVKNLDGAKLSSTVVKNLENLPNALKGFQDVEVEGVTGKIRALTNALSPMLLRIQSAGPAMSSLNSVLRQTSGQYDRARVSVNGMTVSLERQNAQMGRTGGAWASIGATLGGIRTRALAMVGGFAVLRSGFMRLIEPTNQYVEDMNLFAASMGSATDSAAEFAQKCQDLMGIDMGQFARNQGVFQTLITGMGLASEKADVMSQQLTQLGYDIASFYNINVNDAMLKIQSGVAGELEPLRRLGWDLSDARMNLELTKLGIEASTQEMTQAEKVALRYYLIMNQVTITHGDMARTIASPANQLRVLQAQVTLAARAIGNLLIPALNMVLPVCIAAVKAVRLLAQAIADFLGIDATFEVDYSSLDTSGISTGADALDGLGDSADKAKEKVKELKNTVMGFDELNKLQANEKGDGSGKDKGSGAGVGLDLPIDTYDFFEGLTDDISKRTDEMAAKMAKAFRDLLPIVSGIGAGILAWKLAPAFIEGVKRFKALSGMKLPFVGELKGLGGVAGTFAGIAVAIGLCVAHFVNLAENSENFRRGLKAIGDLVSGLPGALGSVAEWFGGMASQVGDAIMAAIGGLDIDPSLKAALMDFGGVIGSIGDAVNEVFDLQWTDAMMVAGAGIALLVPGIGEVVAAILLIGEGISLVTRAIGWAVSPCVEQVDALADVSEETAERFGTSLDSMYAAEKKLGEVDLADEVVSQEDVDEVEGYVSDICDTILSNLDSSKNDQLANLSSLEGMEGIDSAILDEMRENIEGHYASVEESTTAAKSRITAIYQAAATENRDLTQDECDEIAALQEQLKNDLIETSGATQEEIAKIKGAMYANDEAAALEAAQSVLQTAKQSKEDQIAEAIATCDGVIAEAQRQYDAGEISKSAYDEVVAAAQASKDEQIAAAEETYNGVCQKTEEGLGELSSKMDYGNAQIKTEWDVFCENVQTAFDDVSSGLNQWGQDTSAWWRQTFDNLKNTVNRWGEDVGRAWDDICWRASVAGESIGSFLSDPVGHLKTAWAGISGWFDASVVRPLTSAFWAIPNGIRDAINGVIRNLNAFRFELPDPIASVFGSSSFGFNIPYLAKGGQVDTGQLFVARESGPEMVGTMGGRTTVANNQQIVEGIESGVYNAVIQAIAVGGGSRDESGDVVIPVYMDSRELTRIVFNKADVMARRGELKPVFA